MEFDALFRVRFAAVVVVGFELVDCRPRFLPLAGFSNNLARPPIFVIYSLKISEALSLCKKQNG